MTRGEERPVVALIEPCSFGLGFITAALKQGLDFVAVVASLGSPRLYGYERQLQDNPSSGCVVADIYDPQGIMAALTRSPFANRIDAVIGGADLVTDVAAETGELMGLTRGVRPEAAKTARSKDKARHAYGRRDPRLNPLFLELHKGPRDDLARLGVMQTQAKAAAVAVGGYPVVVKPTNCASSQLVILVNNDAEMAKAVERHWELRTWKLALPVSDVVLIEEFVTGPEFSVELFLADDKLVFATVTQKETTSPPYFVELGHVTPTAINQDRAAGVIRAAAEAMRALGIHCGPAHLEFRISDRTGNPVIMETNARPGGDHIATDLVINAFGVNLFESTLDYYLGRQVQITPTKQAASAIAYLSSPKAGILEAIEGLDELEERPFYRAHEALKKRGDAVQPPQDSFDRLAYVITEAPTPAEAWQAAMDAVRSLRVRLASLNTLPPELSLADIVASPLTPAEADPLRRRIATLEARVQDYERFFDQCPLGIYRTTPKGRIVYGNPALLRMLGYSSSEDLAARDLEKEGYEPTYPRKMFKEQIERDGHVKGLEAAWHRRDKSVVILVENAHIVRGPDNCIEYYEGTVEDVTPRRREEALQQMIAEVAHHLKTPVSTIGANVANLPGKLTDLTREAWDLGSLGLSDAQRARLRQVEAEVWTVPSTSEPSSDQRQRPLAERWLQAHGISARVAWTASNLLDWGFTVRRLDELAGGFTRAEIPTVIRWLTLTCNVSTILAILLRSAPAIEKAVDSLRAFGTQPKVRFEPIDLSKLLDNTLAGLAHKIGPGVQIRKDYAADTPLIHGSAHQLSIVCSNLLDNALYAVAGRGTVLVRTKPNGAGGAILEVEDDGPGIADDVKPRIFDPFFTTKPAGVGTGLGLATSYNFVVTIHGGRIEVESKPGRTCLTVYLPVASSK